MMRILLCGSNGLLGQHLALLLGGRTDVEVLNTGRQRSFVFDHLLFDYTQLDLGDRGHVRSLVSSFQPDVIVNTVAAVDVDWCEQHREQAWHANVTTVEHLIEAARIAGNRIVHVSTDYVFDGSSAPYREDDRPDPVNYYGKTKLAAENMLLSSGLPWSIARVSLLFGTGIGIKPNFGTKIVRTLRSGGTVHATRDIGTNPTLAADAARGILAMVEQDRRGIYHISGPEGVDRLTFARLVAETFELPVASVIEVSAADLRLPARRPRWTSFSIDRARTDLGFNPLPLDQAVRQFRRDIMQTVLN